MCGNCATTREGIRLCLACVPEPCFDTSYPLHHELLRLYENYKISRASDPAVLCAECGDHNLGRALRCTSCLLGLCVACSVWRGSGISVCTSCDAGSRFRSHQPEYHAYTAVASVFFRGFRDQREPGIEMFKYSTGRAIQALATNCLRHGRDLAASTAALKIAYAVVEAAGHLTCAGNVRHGLMVTTTAGTDGYHASLSRVFGRVVQTWYVISLVRSALLQASRRRASPPMASPPVLEL